MSRDKKTVLTSLVLFGFGLLLIGGAAAWADSHGGGGDQTDGFTASEPVGAVDNIAPARPGRVTATVDHDAPMITLDFARSADESGWGQLPVSGDLTSGGAYVNTQDVAKYVIDRHQPQNMGGGPTVFEIQGDAVTIDGVPATEGEATALSLVGSIQFTDKTVVNGSNSTRLPLRARLVPRAVQAPRWPE